MVCNNTKTHVAYPMTQHFLQSKYQQLMQKKKINAYFFCYSIKGTDTTFITKILIKKRKIIINAHAAYSVHQWQIRNKMNEIEQKKIPNFNFKNCLNIKLWGKKGK